VAVTWDSGMSFFVAACTECKLYNLKQKYVKCARGVNLQVVLLCKRVSDRSFTAK
jgi:hypothetical protein